MIDKAGKKCSGCGACASICPQKCIEMHSDHDGFQYPRIDHNRCIRCQMCERVCPVLNITPPRDEELSEAWGVFAKNEEVLMRSSSGGLFSLIAQEVLEKGGIVYGAAFSEDYMTVRHMRVDQLSDLECLRRSKYVQSETNGIYECVLNDLNRGRLVLFTGTPCQAAGLLCFLGKEYSNLLTIDVLCHGVPSPLLWRQYLEKRGVSKVITGVSFRDKRHGWKKFGLSIDGQGMAYYKTFDRDLYIQLFLKNYCLRESCYDCQAKRKSSGSDMTIGDFWGVEHVNSGLYNEKGVSIALIHTIKGRACLKRLSDSAIIEAADFREAIAHNPMMYESVGKPPERERFFNDLRTMEWKRFEKKYGGWIWKQRLRDKLSTTLLYRAMKKVKRTVGF